MPVIASAPVPMMRQVRHSCGARSRRVSVRASFVEAGETATLDIVVMSIATRVADLVSECCE